MPLPISEISVYTGLAATPNSYLTPPEASSGIYPSPWVAPPIVNANRNRVQFVELDGSPRSSWRNNGTEITRDLMVLWDSPGGNIEAIKTLIGYPLVVQGGGGRYISRRIPDWFPLLSTSDGFSAVRPYLWCQDIRECSGIDPAPDSHKDAWNVKKYARAHLIAVYRSLPYDILPDDRMPTDDNGSPDEASFKRYITVVPQPSGSIQTLREGTIVYASDGAVVPSARGKMEIKADLEVTWHDVPQAAVGSRHVNPYMAQQVDGKDYFGPIEAGLGKLNNDAFNGNRKGTLLFTAAIIKPIESPIGHRLYTVSYRFSWLPLKSTATYQNNGILDYAYGHVLILRSDVALPIPRVGTGLGYDEAIAKDAPQQSNYLLSPPDDNVNQYDWFDFNQLFRVPALAVDNQ